MDAFLAQPDNVETASTCEPPMTYEALIAMKEAGDISARIGRNEAMMALNTLVNQSFTELETGAINLTDMRAFPWTRFLKNQILCKEIVGRGIERVYGARFYATEQAVILVCRVDGSYVMMKMDKKKGDEFVTGETAQWRELNIVQKAKYIGVSWMQVRRNETQISVSWKQCWKA